MEKRIGTVKKVFEKGFGFIESENEDYFFHFSNMLNPKSFENLDEGTKVSFGFGKDNQNRVIAVDIKEI